MFNQGGSSNRQKTNGFQYAVTVALNHESFVNNPHRISKIKTFINNYNWKERNFPSHVEDWIKFELNN